MAVCRVIKQTEGWNVGDHVEPEGKDLQRLLDEGVVELVNKEDAPKEKKVKEEEVVVDEPLGSGDPKGYITKVEETPNDKIETFTSGQKKVTSKSGK